MTKREGESVSRAEENKRLFWETRDWENKCREGHNWIEGNKRKKDSYWINENGNDIWKILPSTVLFTVIIMQIRRDNKKLTGEKLVRSNYLWVNKILCLVHHLTVNSHWKLLQSFKSLSWCQDNHYEKGGLCFSFCHFFDKKTSCCLNSSLLSSLSLSLSLAKNKKEKHKLEMEGETRRRLVKKRPLKTRLSLKKTVMTTDLDKALVHEL